MNVLTGTSGFSYKEWKGAFYPDDIKNPDMLAYYSSRLPAVEINNTFYRMPRTDVLEGWASQVPPEFRFILKASRRITHFSRLNNVEEPTRYLLQNASVLGDQLGVILFQFPPNFPKNVERLDSFLQALPPTPRFAFEFRNPSWLDDAVIELLTRHNVALCISDTTDKPGVVVRTADWGYLRLRRDGYSPEELDEWAAQISDQHWEVAFVMFKHEDDAAGPLDAEAFRSRFRD